MNKKEIEKAQELIRRRIKSAEKTIKNLGEKIYDLKEEWLRLNDLDD